MALAGIVGVSPAQKTGEARSNCVLLSLVSTGVVDGLVRTIDRRSTVKPCVIVTHLHWGCGRPRPHIYWPSGRYGIAFFIKHEVRSLPTAKNFTLGSMIENIFSSYNSRLTSFFAISDCLFIEWFSCFGHKTDFNDWVDVLKACFHKQTYRHWNAEKKITFFDYIFLIILF